METFAFWKTMNKQTKFSSISGRLVLAAIAATLGPGAGNTRAQAQTQSGLDRIPVTLSDASRPAHVKVSMVNGGITVKAYDGKEVIVEARARNRENSREEGGPKRLAISTATSKRPPGLSRISRTMPLAGPSPFSPSRIS